MPSLGFLEQGELARRTSWGCGFRLCGIPAKTQRKGCIMQHVRITIHIDKILFNPLNEDYNEASGPQLEQLRTKKKAIRVIYDDPRDEAALKLYRDEKGRIGFPMLNLNSCVIEAGRYVKIGDRKGKQISTADSTILPSFLTFLGDFVPFLDQEAAEKWDVDKRQGRNPNGGERVCIVRPKLRDVDAEVNMLINDAQVHTDSVKELLWVAGSRVGLCDFRPDCRGDFGLFRVTRWQIIGRFDKPKFDYVEEDLTTGANGSNTSSSGVAVAVPASSDGQAKRSKKTKGEKEQYEVVFR